MGEKKGKKNIMILFILTIKIYTEKNISKALLEINENEKYYFLTINQILNDMNRIFSIFQIMLFNLCQEMNENPKVGILLNNSIKNPYISILHFSGKINILNFNFDYMIENWGNSEYGNFIIKDMAFSYFNSFKFEKKKILDFFNKLSNNEQNKIKNEIDQQIIKEKDKFNERMNYLFKIKKN